jgi:hypothetical protein
MWKGPLLADGLPLVERGSPIHDRPPLSQGSRAACHVHLTVGVVNLPVRRAAE